MKKSARVSIAVGVCLALIGGIIFFNNYSSSKKANADSSYHARDGFYQGDNSVNRKESEHFQIIWGNSDKTGTVNDSFVEGNLENLENIREFYVEELGMQEPSTSLNSNSGEKYKTNLYIAETGLTKITDNWAYMSTDSEGFGYMVTMPGAMRVDEPSWVLPHEYAHVITAHQKGNIPNGWYEPLANWYRDQFLGSSYYKHGNKTYGPASDFFQPMVLNSDYYFPHVKNYYDAWPLFLYISDNPDNIDGLGKETMLKIINDKTQDNDMFTRIARISGIDIKEILGYYARRMVTLDFERQDCYKAYLNDLLKTESNKSSIYTTLNQNGDWLEVSNDRAPMQGGYNIVPLDVDLSKKQIDVNLAKTSTIADADFRASIVTVTKDDTTRYSTLWNEGKNSIALKGDETKVYLVVCATPNTMKNLDMSNENATGDRYTYKIQVTESDEVTVDSNVAENENQKETTTNTNDSKDNKTTVAEDDKTQQTNESEVNGGAQEENTNVEDVSDEQDNQSETEVSQNEDVEASQNEDVEVSQDTNETKTTVQKKENTKNSEDKKDGNDVSNTNSETKENENTTENVSVSDDVSNTQEENEELENKNTTVDSETPENVEVVKNTDSETEEDNENTEVAEENTTENKEEKKEENQDLSATLAYNNDWETGCCATVKISNVGATLLNGWTIEFDYDREILNVWNAKIVSHEGNHYVIEAPDYNRLLSSNTQISFGIFAGAGSSQDTIQNVKFK